MPETNSVITQATLTITEYGNSVPYSGKLEALAKFQVRKPVMQSLRNDAVKTYDRAAWAQFDLCKLRAFPTSGTSTSAITLTTNGTMTGTNTVAMGVGHIKAIVDTMKERNIPPYVGDDYMAIAWPSTYRTMKNSLETLHQYTAAGIQLIFNAEIGRYENVRFTEQTNVVKGRSTDGVTGTPWSTSLSDWVFFFGEDTVVEGIAIPEEIRAKIPTDYGRSKGVAYYSINGFGLVHNQTDATECRVLKWDSAA
jgi:N4-gp56 family major capsid protein